MPPETVAVDSNPSSSDSKTQAGLGSTGSRSLLTPDADGAYSLHRLTAAVLRTRLGDGAHEAAAASAAVIAASYPHRSDSHENWPDCARLIPHVAALRRHLVDEEFLGRDHGEYWRTGGRVPSTG